MSVLGQEATKSSFKPRGENECVLTCRSKRKKKKSPALRKLRGGMNLHRTRIRDFSYPLSTEVNFIVSRHTKNTSLALHQI